MLGIKGWKRIVSYFHCIDLTYISIYSATDPSLSVTLN